MTSEVFEYKKKNLATDDSVEQAAELESPEESMVVDTLSIADSDDLSLESSDVQDPTIATDEPDGEDLFSFSSDEEEFEFPAEEDSTDSDSSSELNISIDPIIEDSAELSDSDDTSLELELDEEPLEADLNVDIQIETEDTPLDTEETNDFEMELEIGADEEPSLEMTSNESELDLTSEEPELDVGIVEEFSGDDLDLSIEEESSDNGLELDLETSADGSLELTATDESETLEFAEDIEISETSFAEDDMSELDSTFDDLGGFDSDETENSEDDELFKRDGGEETFGEMSFDDEASGEELDLTETSEEPSVDSSEELFSDDGDSGLFDDEPLIDDVDDSQFTEEPTVEPEFEQESFGDFTEESVEPDFAGGVEPEAEEEPSTEDSEFTEGEGVDLALASATTALASAVNPVEEQFEEEDEEPQSKKQKEDVKKSSNKPASTGGVSVVKVCVLSSIITTVLVGAVGFAGYSLFLKDTLATKDDVGYEISLVKQQIKKGSKAIESAKDSYITTSAFEELVTRIDNSLAESNAMMQELKGDMTTDLEATRKKVSAIGQIVGGLENENVVIRNDFAEALQDLKSRAISDETARKASVMALMKLEEAEKKFNSELKKLSQESKADNGDIGVKLNELRAELLKEIEEVYVQTDKSRRQNEDLYKKYNELAMAIDTNDQVGSNRPQRTVAGALGIDVTKGSGKPTYNLSGVVNGKVFINLAQPNQPQKIVTYYVGDYIDGYGKILSVSPVKREVMTESGKVIFR